MLRCIATYSEYTTTPWFFFKLLVWKVPVFWTGLGFFYPSTFETARPKDGWTGLWLTPCHQPISAAYICFCIYARHAGFVREVAKDSEKDFRCPLWLTLLRCRYGGIQLGLCAIHTLRVHHAHAAANLNSGYSKYAKVACVHYFCTIALRTSHAVLTRAWALRRVDLRKRRVDLFSKRVIFFLLVIFKWLLNVLKCLIYQIVKDKKVCLRRVWTRLTTAYLLCASEFR